MKIAFWFARDSFVWVRGGGWNLSPKNIRSRTWQVFEGLPAVTHAVRGFRAYMRVQ